MRQLILMALVGSYLGLANAEPSTATFSLASPDLGGQLTQTQVFNGFGCEGDNISPALVWSNPPAGTKSYAVTVYDPDAPTGSGWWHWLIYNIAAKVNQLPADAGDLASDTAPAGSVQSVTDYGQPGFGGACPPPGDGAHRYVFTVYALEVPNISAEPDTPPAQIGFLLNQHALAKASLIAYYQR